ncbi:MAG: hypothetical protein RL255_93 [Actinomycetota bacterium]
MTRRKFSDRHIGPSEVQISTMLHELGYANLSEFINDVLPESIKLEELFGEDLPTPLTESEAIAELREIAAQNVQSKSFIGMGYYGTHTPPVILRNVLENPAWYTAYTPYQPEISQGRLEAIFAFQTMISDLTGLPIANASMLDEATAAAEAMTLARRNSKASDDAVFFVDENVHPQTKAVLQTRAKPLNIQVKIGNLDSFTGIDAFGLLIQYPNTFGELSDLTKVISEAKTKETLVIMATDLLALTIIKSPGEWQADIAVGSAQRFGVPMGFGSEHRFTWKSCAAISAPNKRTTYPSR